MSFSQFQPSRRTLLVDRWMDRFIRLGGIGIIAAVLGIFLFIFAQVLPLFSEANVERIQSVQLPNKDYRLLGIDEWGELPFAVTPAGELTFADLSQNGKAYEELLPLENGRRISAMAYYSDGQILVYGTEDGKFGLTAIDYQPDFSGKTRKIHYSVKNSPLFPFLPETVDSGAPPVVRRIDYGSGPQGQWVAAILDNGAQTELHWVQLQKEESLLGEGELTVRQRFNLTPLLGSAPEKVRVNENGEIILVGTRDGKIHYLQNDGGEVRSVQQFLPFGDLTNNDVASMDFILGGVSVYFTHPSGVNRIYSLYIPKGENQRLFGKTKEFPALPGGSDFFSKSLRNKAFLVGNEHRASLRFATTEQIRWEKNLPFMVRLGVLTKKYHRIAFLDQDQQIHLYRLEDPHPEASWKSLFGKVWYEGAPEPTYAWQSTGGSDAFEPKLSLMPLIVGTLKGTCYALLFAVPIALLAALYTSQFLQPNLRKTIKPVMEIMASLPSVILGFLAALWLAPLIEDKIPSLMLVILFIPIGSILFGILWNHLPRAVQEKLPSGQEWLLLIPLLALTSWGVWQLGPALERWAFVVTDPSTGQGVADFRLWWSEATGSTFEQRNSLVVGFMMGFAVIPIIFTISEDSLSAVPQTLRSGSLALGASRWQTAYHVVLPAATVGIFSAIMIGFGRAVGETMIVLMATGNTPLMDFNIFTGMRTLSANLAVELPEAPFHGTLYRVLFLGALLLFLMTFSVNSLAEMMRQRINKKFKNL